MDQRQICVIFNPTAGKHRARRRLAKLRERWGSHVVFQPTTHAHHAVALAEEAARADFGIVVAAGGDGTVHEVANGLLRAGRSDVRFGILPIGSANDYAFSVASASTGTPGPLIVDVGRVSRPGGREAYFVCCLGLGLNGAVTLESRRIAFLQGMALYGLATLRALWRRYAHPAMTITLDDDPPWQTDTLLFSTLLGKREGGFVLAPEARLDDGWFDYVHAGALTRWQVLRLLPRIALSGPPKDYPQVRQGRCRRVHLTSAAPLIVHLDGEFFCLPEDNVRELQIDLLPRALTVELLSV